MTQFDGAVLPETSPRTVTQRIPPDPEFVQACKEGVRQVVRDAIIVLECFLELPGKKMKGFSQGTPWVPFPFGKGRSHLLHILESVG